MDNEFHAGSTASAFLACPYLVVIIHFVAIT